MSIDQDILVKCMDCGFVTSYDGLLNDKCPECEGNNIVDEN